MIIGLASECLSRPGVWFQTSLWAYLIAKPFQPVTWSEGCLRFMRKLRRISFHGECAGRQGCCPRSKADPALFRAPCQWPGSPGLFPLCVSNPRRITDFDKRLMKHWDRQTDRHVWCIHYSSVKSHLLCPQKVLQAGQLIHMLTSYTALPWSWASQFLCFQRPTKLCPAFHPKLWSRVTHHMLPYTPDTEHKCFGPQS